MSERHGNFISKLFFNISILYLLYYVSILVLLYYRGLLVLYYIIL